MDTRRRPDGALPQSIRVERAKRAAVAFHISTLGASRVLWVWGEQVGAHKDLVYPTLDFV